MDSGFSFAEPNSNWMFCIEMLGFELESAAERGCAALTVVDPLKRTWEKGVYMGADSTNPEAVRRHRPQG